jgi:hypothetical protein
MAPAAAPVFADGNAAFVGSVTVGATQVPTALLIVRDGRFVHTWTLIRTAGDPLPDLFAVARAVFKPDGQVRGTPESHDLKSRLPSPDDLPPGFVPVRLE